MKTMLEIVRLVRAHTDIETKYIGMCATSMELYRYLKLTLEEMSLFKSYIYRKRTKKSREWQKETGLGYFYPPGDKTPRIKFLDRLIKQLEKENDQPIQKP